ncbi:MAG: phage Gp37/Gp68 family protein [Muribaculaceae bacterium]|nr:phage Gp37/Gp68 family protein [Muribaculaceae bacterium]
MLKMWNLIHGCHRKSEGCKNCYVFARDEQHGIDTNIVHKTLTFDLPLKRDRYKNWKIPSGSMVMTCFSSDFFIEEMDEWRSEAWDMMRIRNDLRFYIVTKRPERMLESLPEYWNEIKDRIFLCCTMESQRRADERLPIFKSLPLVHKDIIVEPMLESIDFRGQLDGIDSVTVGGESAKYARPCHYNWVLDIRGQCIEAGIHFHFKQTGGNFIKDGKTYKMNHRLQMSQASKQ